MKTCMMDSRPHMIWMHVVSVGLEMSTMGEVWWERCSNEKQSFLMSSLVCQVCAWAACWRSAKLAG